jgi:hypothetical protein
MNTCVSGRLTTTRAGREGETVGHGWDAQHLVASPHRGGGAALKQLAEEGLEIGPAGGSQAGPASGEERFGLAGALEVGGDGPLGAVLSAQMPLLFWGGSVSAARLLAVERRVAVAEGVEAPAVRRSR